MNEPMRLKTRNRLLCRFGLLLTPCSCLIRFAETRLPWPSVRLLYTFTLENVSVGVLDELPKSYLSSGLVASSQVFRPASSASILCPPPTRHPDPCFRQYTTRQHETWYVCPGSRYGCLAVKVCRIFTKAGRYSTDLS
jgi:hypothetical protein